MKTFFKTLWIYWFCQDDLENYFRKQRAIGRRCDNLTVCDFGYNDNIIKSQFSVRPIAVNVQGPVGKFNRISDEPLPKRKKRCFALKLWTTNQICICALSENLDNSYFRINQSIRKFRYNDLKERRVGNGLAKDRNAWKSFIRNRLTSVVALTLGFIHGMERRQKTVRDYDFNY